MMGNILYNMMDRSWIIKTLFFTLTFSSLFTIAKGDPVEYDPEKIVETFNGAFMASYDDFITPHPQDNYFPFKKARKENVYIERDNHENINSVEKAMNLTRELQEWRGFKTIETLNMSQLEPFLEEFKTLSQSTQSNFINSKLNKAQLEELSCGWLSLLAQPKIMEETSVDNMVDIYNEEQLNAILLYKFLILLRDPSNGSLRDGFMSMRIPEYLYNHVGYLIGYRWNLEKRVTSEPTSLMVLPSDIIVRMQSDVLENLGIFETLSETSAKSVFEAGDQQRQNAWFIRYLTKVGWDKAFDSREKLSQFGHLMAGATLEYLQRLELNQTFSDDQQNLNVDQDHLFEVVKENSFSRAREQVLWEALKLNHREEIFDKKAIKLDISQLLAQMRALGLPANTLPGDVSHVVETQWFNKKTFYPEVNAEFFTATRMASDWFKASDTWTARDFSLFGTYTKMLSPKQISTLLGNAGEETILDEDTTRALVTPTQSMAQLNEIYKKVKAQIVDSDSERDREIIDSSLFPALSSADLLSSKPHFIWTEHKDKLLEASDMFTRAQMSALHELIKPGKWNSANMSSILANHPKCLDDDPPSKVMKSLDLILEGFETVPEKFYTIAEKLQMIPRHLKMAWLEKSLAGKEVIPTEFLLDKPSKDAIMKEGIVNPEPRHPLTSTFKKFFSSNTDSFLPSLVLAGMSCKHIEMIEAQDTMEVLALYRYQVDQYGNLMPSSTRKCWAKKVRDYLMFKASVLNITVTTETELLSMLNTPEIKTIGGEILLTWGGSALSSIVNPEVNHEVLMEVSLTKPVTFLTNGVKYSCVKEMAAAMLGLMLEHEKGSMDLTVLAHTHNLLPFAGNSTVKAEAEDIKNYFRTVLRPEDKLMCLRRDDRAAVRNLIMKAFGSPENWNSLDLVELGDLLIVLEAEDWTKVDPTTLRMAAEELAFNTKYSDMITEPRHSTVPVPYHEACALWLGDDQGAESQESKDYADQWRMYSRYIVVGNHLQFKVLDNGADTESIQPRGHRRRREADGAYDFKANYTYVMNKLNTMFREGSMSEEQKINATNIIIGTQELLADQSFAVLGLERNGMSQQEVLGVLQQYRDSGNMTSEQSAAIAKLAVDTQARMVQGLAPVLQITPEELNITQETWDAIMKMETFNESPDETTATTLAPGSDTPARDLLDDGAEAPQETTTLPAADEDSSNRVGESGTSLSTSSTTTASTSEASSTSSTTLEASSTESTTSTQSTVSSTESTTAATASSTESTSSVSTSSTESTTSASTVSTTTLPDNYREGRDEEVSSSTTESTTSSSTASSSTEAITSSSSSTTSSDSEEVVQDSTESSTLASSTEETLTSSSTEETPSSSSTEASTTAPETSSAASSTTPASVDDNLSSVLKQNELLNLETFSSYEPDTAAFNRIPHLKSITLTCRVVRAAKNAAAALSSNCINKMSQEDMVNCWDILGHIPWPSSSLVPVWNVVKESITTEYQGEESPINRDLMLQLETLMPAIVSESPDLINVAKENIDGISLLERLLSWEDAKAVVQRYIDVNSKSKDSPLTRVEAGALGPLLCGLNDDQWSTLITNQTFPSLITRYLATLDCPVPTGAAGHLSELLVAAYGSAHTWSTADVLSMGWMVATLSPEQLASIPSHAMEGLTGQAVKHFTALQWTSLTAGQLQYMSPHTASFISVKKLASMADMGSKMREIRAAVGEDPMVAGEMEKMFDSGSPSLQCSVLLLVLAVWAFAL